MLSLCGLQLRLGERVMDYEEQNYAEQSYAKTLPIFT